MSADNDIELLAGQVWHAPLNESMANAHFAALDDMLSKKIQEFNAEMRDFLKPQVNLLRRAPLPEESELLHDAPHYGYLIEKKGGES